jgi:hypothetical protein
LFVCLSWIFGCGTDCPCRWCTRWLQGAWDHAPASLLVATLHTWRTVTTEAADAGSVVEATRCGLEVGSLGPFTLVGATAASETAAAAAKATAFPAPELAFLTCDRNKRFEESEDPRAECIPDSLLSVQIICFISKPQTHQFEVGPLRLPQRHHSCCTRGGFNTASMHAKASRTSGLCLKVTAC